MTVRSENSATVCCKSDDSVRAFNLMKALVALGLLGLLLLAWWMGWAKPGWNPSGAEVPVALAPPVATPSPPPAPVAAPVAPAVPVVASVPVKVASLSTQWADGKLKLSGQVGSTEEKERSLEAARQAFGADKVTDDLQVVSGLGPAEWIELNGEATTEAGRASAEAAVRKAWGSKLRVDNRILVRAETATPAAVAPVAAESCEVALKRKLAFFQASAALTVSDRAALMAMLPCLQGVKFEIAGHTDNTGQESTNLKLSDARANVARRFLMRRGLKGEDIKATGYGSGKPVASNDTVEGRRENRRVEVVRQ